MILRAATPEDIGQRGDNGIRDLFNKVRRHERHYGRSPLAPPQYGSWASMMTSDSAQVLVAEDKGSIVGFCLARHLLRQPSTTLDKMFIAPEWSRAGLGRALFNAVALQASLLRKKFITTCAESGPDRASGFYQHLGFAVITTQGKKDYLRYEI